LPLFGLLLERPPIRVSANPPSPRSCLCSPPYLSFSIDFPFTPGLIRKLLGYFFPRCRSSHYATRDDPPPRAHPSYCCVSLCSLLFRRREAFSSVRHFFDLSLPISPPMAVVSILLCSFPLVRSHTPIQDVAIPYPYFARRTSQPHTLVARQSF